MGDPIWRVGHKLGRTLYRGDVLCGMLDTTEIAARVVEALNGDDVLLAENERLRAALEAIRDGMRDYSRRGMGEDLPCDFEVPPSTNKALRRVIDAALAPRGKKEE